MRQETSCIEAVLASLPAGRIVDVRVGAFVTAVLVEHAHGRQCGLASTLRCLGRHPTALPPVERAGQLTDEDARQLAQLLRSSSQTEASVGMAAANALLPRPPSAELRPENAAQIIAQMGRGKRVVLVGHFRFTETLASEVGLLQVLEKRPTGADLPAEKAAEVVPQADVVAITATALINHSFDELLALRRPGAAVIVLGPSTPLAPVLFERGVQVLSGALVDDETTVLRAVEQGAHFRQLKGHGVNWVSWLKPT